MEDIGGLRSFIAALWTAFLCDPPYSATFSLHLKTLECPSYPFSDSIRDFCRAINRDEASQLQNNLMRPERAASRPLDGATQPQLFDLLEYAILCSSRSCVDVLTKYIKSVAPTDPNGTGNIFHRLTESIGFASKSVVNSVLHHDEFLQASNHITNRAQLISDVVHALAEKVYPALNTKDFFGRLPLHYASLYGLTGLCSAYLEHMVTTQETSSAQIQRPLFVTDADKYTCLDLSILGGHLQTTKRLLESLQSATLIGGVEFVDGPEYLIGQALNVALRRHNDPQRAQLAQYLLSLLPDITHAGPYGEMALYFAARYGCQDLSQDIVARCASPQKLLNTPHSLHGWTPLIAACVEGHPSEVTILTVSGADPVLSDAQGWTAKEHAAFRGHLNIAKLLLRTTPGNKVQLDYETAVETESKTPLRTLPSHRRQLPVAEEKTQILLTLGPSNTRSKKQVADISPLLVRQDGLPCDNAGYALSIDGIYANGPKPFIRLPIFEDTINQPWWFSTDDADRAGFVFNLVRLDDLDREDGTLIASGIALLKDLKRGFAFQHESLDRDYTIPLLQKETRALAGTVTFAFLIITPLPCPNAPPEATCGFWKTGLPTQVVGHRGTSAGTMRIWNFLAKYTLGSGANAAARNSLQIGENTIQVS